MAGLGCIKQNAAGSAKPGCPEDVIQCGQGESDDFLGCVYDSLEICPVCLCAVGVP